ncbi:MAG TPA: lysylphosphatidylglycerol synthase transmembrane domain-containing protein [Trebonia sp.]|nr:lysylphosphatidylglycerol synthase transmembrane domain-containing protein [Trebonia sp.]
MALPRMALPKMALLSRIIGSRIVRYGFVVVAVGLGAYGVAAEWDKIGPALGRIGVPISLASLALTLAALVASIWTWRVLLAGLGSPLPFGVAARVMFIGQLGKYLPGAVGPVLAQMELATAHGVPRSRTASAGLVNMPVSVLSALLAALVTLPFTGGPAKYLWFIAATPLLLACLHPKVLNYLLGLMFKLARRPPLEHPLTGKVIAVSVAWSFVSYLLYGAALWLLAIRVGVPAGIGYPLSVGAFALGFALGFVIIFASAGVGPRELVMIAILGHLVGVDAATAVTLVYRVVTVAGDGIVAGLALANRRSRANRAKTGIQATSPNALGPDVANAPRLAASRRLGPRLVRKLPVVRRNADAGRPVKRVKSRVPVTMAG